MANPNILITNDDGPDAPGLEILREAVYKVWPTSEPIVIVPARKHDGASFALTHATHDGAEGRLPWNWWRDAPAREYATNRWSIDLSPADIVHRAFQGRGEFTLRDWDVVLVGVNAGANVGFDIWHSGTFSQAMIASRAYGTCAHAFSQEMEPGLITDPSLDRRHFAMAEAVLPDYLRKTAPDAGALWNVNFPTPSHAPTPKGYAPVPIAHYSYYRTPPTSIVPRARNEKSDITELQQGFTTISSVQIRINPSLRY